MAQHGYLHDSYDRDDFGRGDDDRERSWRDRDEERSWRGRHGEGRWQGSEDSRDREGMFGGWSEQDRYSNERSRDDGRGFFERTKDEAKSWFGDDHRDHDRYGSERDRWQGASNRSSGFGGSERYSAHPDDHYRSWRDKQMQALDRDYQDYCREREQQFHSDFDSWRQNRQQSQQSSASSEAMELNNPAPFGGEVQGATTSDMGAATIGTNNSENTASAPGATGRGRSR